MVVSQRALNLSTKMFENEISYNCFTIQKMTVRDLLERMDDGYIEGVTKRWNSFQRWNQERRSRLIESILMNQPQPALFLDGSQKTTYVLDGMQILMSIRDYVNNRYELQSLLLNVQDIEGLKFEQLKPTLQYRLLNFPFLAYVIVPGTSNMQRVAIYASIERDVHQLSYYRRIIYTDTFPIVDEYYERARNILFQARGRSYAYTMMHGRTNFEDMFCQLATLLLCQESRYNVLLKQNIEICVNYVLQNYDMTLQAFSSHNLENCFFRISNGNGLDRIFSFRSHYKQLIFLAVVALSDVEVNYEKIENVWKNVTKVVNSKIFSILECVKDILFNID